MAKVLIVDNFEGRRDVIKSHIEKLEYTVISETDNYYKAFHEYKIFKPNIVTIDINNISIDNGINYGLECLTLIKQFDKSANIIVVSSQGEEKLLIEALTIGAKGYIIKPINQEKIKNAFEGLQIG